jgi:CRP/FNR family cyclic AMP-dependent transcriptional regulator
MQNNQLLQYLSFFKKVSLFSDLSESQIKKMINLMSLSKVKQNEIIVREGANEDTLFILLKGEVEISKTLLLPMQFDPNTRQEKSLIILSEKQYPFFGEMALLEEQPERSASITAKCPCTLAVLKKKDLINILHTDPLVGSIFYKNIAIELVKRLKKANKDILKLTTAFTLALEG